MAFVILVSSDKNCTISETLGRIVCFTNCEAQSFDNCTVILILKELFCRHISNICWLRLQTNDTIVIFTHALECSRNSTLSTFVFNNYQSATTTYPCIVSILQSRKRHSRFIGLFSHQLIGFFGLSLHRHFLVDF